MSSILSLPFVSINRASEWVDPNNGMENIHIDCRTPTARPISASRQRFASVPRNMVPHAPKSRETCVGARQTADNTLSFLVKVSDDMEHKPANERIKDLEILLRQMKTPTDPNALYELSAKLMKAACTNCRYSAIEADSTDPVVVKAKEKAAEYKAESEKQAQLAQERALVLVQIKKAEAAVARANLEEANAVLKAMPPTSAKPENSHNRGRAKNPSRGRGQRQPTPSR